MILTFLLGPRLSIKSSPSICLINYLRYVPNPGNLTEFNELPTLAPESGNEISDMASSLESGIGVESQSREDNQDPPVLP
ncbi:hypothetical protein O181_072770 [Austropuccinia psidii MF-1]|uniref:Uncharacterized protein n=1 Tax=Austropuccinia psidii MF-1 TaxID=1389203 RepID=A0A9Q3F164_9BASI|nr:hypothetical protein [Austropuccinia psidii MF-1]